MASETSEQDILKQAIELEKDLEQRKKAISREERESNIQNIYNLLAGINAHATFLRGRIQAYQEKQVSYPTEAAAKLAKGLEEFAEYPTYAKYKLIKDELDKPDHGEFAGFDQFSKHRGNKEAYFYLVHLILFFVLSSMVVIGSLGLASILPAIASDTYAGFVIIGGACLAFQLAMSPSILAGTSTLSERTAYLGCEKMLDVLLCMREISKTPENQSVLLKKAASESTTASSIVTFFKTMRKEGAKIPKRQPIELPQPMLTLKSWLRQKRF